MSYTHILSVKALRERMTNMDHARFNCFTLYIRTKARKELSQGRLSKQDPARWARFKSQVAREFPELLEYEEQWPIESYFHQYSKSGSGYRNRCTAVASAPKTPPKRRVTFFVGGTPRHRPHCTTRVATNNEMSRLIIHPKILPPKTLNLSHLANTMNADVSGKRASSGVPQPPDTAEVFNDTIDRSYMHALQEGNSDSTDYPVPCAKCGAVPTFAPSFNKEISKILPGNNALVPVLSSLGIISDHHLSVYKHWGSTTFFNSLCENLINPLHKAILEKYLSGDFVKNRRTGAHSAAEAPSSSVSTKFKPFSFPQPSPEHEARIIQATSSEELRKAMGLEDDVAHYILLTKYIDDTIKDMNMQPEQGEWSSIVNKICNNCPELGDFQNTWPISFYVRWKHARICSGRHRSTMPREPSSSLATSGIARTDKLANSAPWISPREVSQPKGVPWSGCLIHPLPRALDASPKLIAHLRAFGMEELSPVFLYAEIRTDDDFDLYSSLDEKGRKSLFNSLGKTFSLRPFQRLMLDVVIREASVTGR